MMYDLLTFKKSLFQCDQNPISKLLYKVFYNKYRYIILSKMKLAND